MSGSEWQRYCEAAAACAREAQELAEPLRDAPVELSPDVVHDIRVLCKRLRAAWQGVRSATWEEAAWVETAVAANGALRDAARALAGPREAHVLRKTIIRLTRGCSDPGMLEALELALDAVREQHPAAHPAPDDLVELPALFAEEVSRWLLLATAAPPAALPRAGPVRSYRRAAGRARRGIRDNDAEAFHAWRKWVKYELYQLDLLLPESAWRGRRRRLARLGDALGRYHDLCDLAQVVRGADFRCGHPAAYESLDGLLASRFRRAEARFVRRFARLYGRSEARYARRLARHLDDAA